MSVEVTACAACGTELPVGARFCPACGNRVEGAGDTRVEELPRLDSHQGPTNVIESEPRVIGLAPPVLTLALAAAALAAGIVFVVLDRPVLGFVVLALGVLLLLLFVGAARRQPRTPLTRSTARTTGTMSAWTHYAVGSLGAWSQARRAVTQARREQRALHAERSQAQLALGEAAYRENEGEMAPLRARIRDLDTQLLTLEEATRRTVEEARSRVDREREAVRPTQRIEPEDDGSDRPLFG